MTTVCNTSYYHCEPIKYYACHCNYCFTVLAIAFSQDDYRVREGSGPIITTVTKNFQIANPLTLTVTPLTVDQASEMGHVLTNVPPDDNPYSPNRAKSKQYHSASLIRPPPILTSKSCSSLLVGGLINVVLPRL